MNKEKILIINRHPDIIEILKDRLEKENFEVMESVDWPSGLSLPEKESPSVILLEDSFLDSGNAQGASLVSSKYPGAKVILLDTSHSHLKKRKAYIVDIDEILLSPFNPKALLKAIRKVTGKTGEAKDE